MANAKTLDSYVPGEGHVVVWSFDASGNGEPASFPHADTITLQATGPFGGGTLNFQGSNDGTTFFALPSAIALVSAIAHPVADNSRGFQFYRPSLTGATSPSILLRAIAQGSRA